jgi:hypothetical protein
MANCKRWLTAPWRYSRGIALGIGLGLLAGIAPARAAEEVVLTYGLLGASVTIEDFEYLAETGEVPSNLRFYFNVSGADPEVIQTILTTELPVDLMFVDSTLNSLPGEFALFEIGQVIHTRSRRANIQALRAALVLSVSEDNSLTLLEFLQNYPTQQLYIDGIELAKVARDVAPVVRDLQEVAERIQIWVTVARGFLEDMVCECEPEVAPDPVDIDSSDREANPTNETLSTEPIRLDSATTTGDPALPE